MGGGQIPPTAGSRSSPVSSIQRNARQKHLAAPAAHALYSPLATPECNGGGSIRLTNDKPAEKSVFLKKNSFVPLTSIIFCTKNNNERKKLNKEQKNAKKPLPEGPFAKLLKTISLIQKKFT